MNLQSKPVLVRDLGKFIKDGCNSVEHYGVFICPECNQEYTTAIRWVSAGKSMRCKKCSIKRNADTRRLSMDQFITKAEEVHGSRYMYAMGPYKSNNTKVQIICAVHGEFWQTPNAHLAGQGCPVCGREQTKTTNSTYIEKATIVHNGKYDYSKVVYSGTNNKVTIICPTHGEFSQRAAGHLHGQGCPKCAIVANNFVYRTVGTEPTDLYYIYFPELNLWKIGCTRVGVYKRFRYEIYKYEVLHIIHFTNGADAYFVEQQLLHLMGNDRYFESKPLKCGGDTELLKDEVHDFLKVAYRMLVNRYK